MAPFNWVDVFPWLTEAKLPDPSQLLLSSTWLPSRNRSPYPNRKRTEFQLRP